MSNEKPLSDIDLSVFDEVVDKSVVQKILQDDDVCTLVQMKQEMRGISEQEAQMEVISHYLSTMP